MLIEQLYTNCLSEAAYYIESEGEAAIIDPLRETNPYIEKLETRKTKLKYVFETHFHADFVSGHIDLANKTGAQIIYGPDAKTDYKVYNAADGEEFKLGKLTIRALHTPGHTLESTCYLLIDESGKEYCIFTGDTLFVGDVGRPDLLDGLMTKEELASKMYDSLNNKIKPLRDDVIVYPAHGPGSACGKNLGKETFSTIGVQKKTNYALQEMTREEFIQQVTDGLNKPPQYFFEDARINKSGYQSIDTVITKNSQPLSLSAFEEAIQNGALVLDTRINHTFEKGFIPGSLNIGLNGSFAVWVGTLIQIDRPLVLVTEDGKVEESVLRLARVGYENVLGYLEGGFETWKNAGREIQSVHSISAEEMAALYNTENYEVLDIRRPGEYESSHVKGAIHIPLNELASRRNELDPNKNYLMHCATGYRTIIASSLLKQYGISNFVNIYGGFGAITHTDMPVESSVPELT